MYTHMYIHTYAEYCIHCSAGPRKNPHHPRGIRCRCDFDTCITLRVTGIVGITSANVNTLYTLTV